jgi:hypothetical protein
MVAGSGDRKAKKGRSPALYRPHEEDKIPVLIAKCSEQTLALAVVLSSNSLDLGEDRLVRVDMLRLRPTKVLYKRSGASGDEYKCEFEPGWLAADLVERTKMGRVHIRTYEETVTHASRLQTLRSAKRTFEEMEAS